VIARPKERVVYLIRLCARHTIELPDAAGERPQGAKERVVGVCKFRALRHSLRESVNADPCVGCNDQLSCPNVVNPYRRSLLSRPRSKSSLRPLPKLC